MTYGIVHLSEKGKGVFLKVEESNTLFGIHLGDDAASLPTKVCPGISPLELLLVYFGRFGGKS
jgi:hypothetical protein